MMSFSFPGRLGDLELDFLGDGIAHEGFPALALR